MILPQALQPLHAFFMVTSFVLGCMVGSFCNVCICRWPAGESVVSPRSRCPKCKNAIAWYDNIPLLSWLLLGAKCRHCSLPISWQYPLVEAVTGVLFLLVYWRFGFSPATPIYMVLSAGLVIATFQDLSDWTIPNEITLPGILAGLGVALIGMTYDQSFLRVTHPLDALDGITLAAFLICLLDGVTVLLLKKPGMGFGDVKLLAMLGAFLGWKGVIGTLLIASVLGSVIGILLIFVFRAKADGEEAEEEAPEEEPGYPPVDSLGAVVLGVCTLYLFARVAIALQFADSLPKELFLPLLSGAIAIALLAVLIVGFSMHIYNQQKRDRKHAAHEQKAEEDTEGDEMITLRGHYLPFGPYLALGGLIFMFFGPELIRLYTTAMHAAPPAPGLFP